MFDPLVRPCVRPCAALGGLVRPLCATALCDLVMKIKRRRGPGLDFHVFLILAQNQQKSLRYGARSSFYFVIGFASFGGWWCCGSKFASVVFKLVASTPGVFPELRGPCRNIVCLFVLKVARESNPPCNLSTTIFIGCMVYVGVLVVVARVCVMFVMQLGLAIAIDPFFFLARARLSNPLRYFDICELASPLPPIPFFLLLLRHAPLFCELACGPPA